MANLTFVTSREVINHGGAARIMRPLRKKAMSATAFDSTELSKISVTKALLSSGAISSLLYIAMNVFVPMLWDSYSCVTQTVSELSAIGAPTRVIWFPFGVLYAITFGLFGYGVIRVARGSKTVLMIGRLIIIYGCFSIYWPPMHLRGTETNISDTLHIAWTIITVLLMIATMSLATVTFNRSFKIYTIVSVLALITFGILTSQEAPNIPLNLPTPTIGIWERLNIGVFMVWIIVLSIRFMKREDEHQRTPHRDSSLNMYASAGFKSHGNKY